MQLSGAKTYNNLPKDENGDEIELDGFSDNVNSIEAYFERSGFSARVSRRYRSAFTATTRSVISEHTEKHANRCGEPDRRADRL